MIFLVAKLALANRYAALHWLKILMFTVPAAYAGYSIVLELSELAIISSLIWQHIFAVMILEHHALANAVAEEKSRQKRSRRRAT